MARKRPWWSHQRWTVKTVAVRDGTGYRRGDWIEIYATSTKAEAQKLAKEWSARMKTSTTVEPGPGHLSRRDL